jgi:glutamate/tyrosine decarboxylase-like PLP-dependent enzyme
MTDFLKTYGPALDRARAHTDDWLTTLPDRKVPPRAGIEDILKAFGTDLPDGPTDPAEVVDLLAETIEPGLMAMPSGRFFGWVIGGTLPAALAADWLVSAWDQNTGMRFATPGTTGVEEIAGTWVLDLLGLPASADVAFVTGGTMANYAGLAAGRQYVLNQEGWNLDRDGLTGAPKVHVLVGEDRHSTIDLTLRYLGLGAPTPVRADDQGRIDVDELAKALDRVDGPTIVALQAGNLHSGSFDPMAEAIKVAHLHGAWVHVDGAFGLWAAASPTLRPLLAGFEHADSWSTDAHKTLNTPYDCGIVVCANPHALRGAFGVQASYFQDFAANDVALPGDPFIKVPELSRRARGVPVWAAIRSLGRSGVTELVERLVANAKAIAEGFGTIEGAEVLHDVVFTQVCVSFGSDARTAAVTEALLREGTAWMSGSRWRDRAVLRVSVSNWSTDEQDVEASIAAVRRAVAEVGA